MADQPEILMAPASREFFKDMLVRGPRAPEGRGPGEHRVLPGEPALRVPRPPSSSSAASEHEVEPLAFMLKRAQEPRASSGCGSSRSSATPASTSRASSATASSDKLVDIDYYIVHGGHGPTARSRRYLHGGGAGSLYQELAQKFVKPGRSAGRGQRARGAGHQQGAREALRAVREDRQRADGAAAVRAGRAAHGQAGDGPVSDLGRRACSTIFRPSSRRSTTCSGRRGSPTSSSIVAALSGCGGVIELRRGGGVRASRAPRRRALDLGPLSRSRALPAPARQGPRGAARARAW